MAERYSRLLQTNNYMNETLKNQLRQWADVYQTADFIPHDPVQFPHRYSKRQDIEIAGLLTALISFGNRSQILQKADTLMKIMGDSPFRYVRSDRWQEDFPADKCESFYRMIPYSAMNGYFARLHQAYAESETLEEYLFTDIVKGNPMERMCAFLGVSAKSPQKKINMFLRWMIRRDSPVDFGIWRGFLPSQLIIPLDTHVCRASHKLGLTTKPTFSLTNAKAITQSLAEVFPNDPVKGDFALFGAGVNGVV